MKQHRGVGVIGSYRSFMAIAGLLASAVWSDGDRAEVYRNLKKGRNRLAKLNIKLQKKCLK
jgi:hypothetical protein